VSLRLIDGLGRIFPVKAEGLQTAGTHHLLLEGTALQAGIYYLELMADGQRSKVTLVLAK
jgi:hypothetical protein